MLGRCVAANSNNIQDPHSGIFLQRIPLFGDSQPEAIRRRKNWVDFVTKKRAHWEATKYYSVCSKHFKPEDYEHRFMFLPG